MEKYVDMKSPLTGGRVKEICTIEEKEFRKEKYNVHVRYYICEDTGEQFTTTAQDTLQFNDLYAQYRVKHGIPFPDEIREIRQQYGLNYSQISRILGFGVNQYAKYESGEVPSESNGKMIATIRDKSVILNLLKACQADFQPSEYQKVLDSITLSKSRNEETGALDEIIFKNVSRSIYNGYGQHNVNKIFDMVRYILYQHGEVFPTKLNKLMFYADFIHYREVGLSISGLPYRALKYGPVPHHYATIYDNVTDINKRSVLAHDTISTLLSYDSGSDYDSLTDKEKSCIDYIVAKLKPMSVKEIIEMSHRENGWIECASAQDYIPYDFAFDLKLV